MRLPWTRDWELIDKEVQESDLEQMQRLKWAPEHLSPCNLDKRVILTFKCKLTGKIKVRVIKS